LRHNPNAYGLQGNVYRVADARAEALRDGVLIAVSGIAREAGFKYPVALTAAAWAKCVAVPPGVGCQDESARRRNVVWLLACAARGGNGGRGTRIGARVRNDNREPDRRGSEALGPPVDSPPGTGPDGLYETAPSAWRPGAAVLRVQPRG
jgi:hypothetical protein